MEEDETAALGTVIDWNEQPDKLPDMPPSVAEAKFVRLFAVGVAGQPGHDQFVYLVPNGLAIVGLAPSHALLQACKGPQAPADAATGPAQQAQEPLVDHSPQAKRQRQEPSQHENSRAGAQAGLHAGAAHSQPKVQQGAASGDELLPPSPLRQQLLQQQQQAGSTPQELQSADQQQQQPQAASNMPDHHHHQQQQQQQQQQHNSIPGGGACKASHHNHQHSSQEQQHQKPQRGGRGQNCSHGQSSLPFTPDQLASVNFDIGKRSADQKQSGKKKKSNQGVSVLESNSVLCRLEGNNGKHMPVRAVASGRLLEVNQRLRDSPRLLLEKPLREGYIAIFAPSDSQRASLIRSLLSVEQYIQLKGLSRKDLAH